jgi:hypothetical protein
LLPKSSSDIPSKEFLGVLPSSMSEMDLFRGSSGEGESELGEGVGVGERLSSEFVVLSFILGINFEERDLNIIFVPSDFVYFFFCANLHN